jgi:hypothetical protein
MAWRALTPEAEQLAKYQRQQGYREALEAQIAQRQQGGGAEGRSSGRSPQHDISPPARREQQPAGSWRPEASPPAAAARAPARAAAAKVEARPYAMDVPASPAYAPEPEPAPGSPLWFEPQTPSPLPEGSPRRLHSVALLPQHEQEERHAQRDQSTSKDLARFFEARRTVAMKI